MKTEPTFTPEPSWMDGINPKLIPEPFMEFDDDFGDMATLAATATESQVCGDHYYLESTFAKPRLDDFGDAEAVSALDTQVDGDHYNKRAIQPVEFCYANGLNFIEGSIVKYITRWRDKGGVKDLNKIKHYVDLLIELENKYVKPT